MDQIELIEKMRRLEEEKEREREEGENDGVLEDENEIAKNNENDKDKENEGKEIEDIDLVDLDASEGGVGHGIDVVIAMNQMNSRVVELENKVAWYKTALDAAVDSASNMMKT